MFSVQATVAALGGVATRQQLIAAGLSGFDLTIAVGRGEVRRVRQARYVTADASFDAVAAARVGGLLAGTSAARSYGLWSGFDTRLHLSVGANSARLRTNVPPSFTGRPTGLTPDTSARRIVLHWLEGGAVPELGPECWRVPLPVCLRQVVAWCDRETAIATLDTALALLPRGLVLDAFASAPVSQREVVAECRPGSDSGYESIVRQRLGVLGIVVIQQVRIPGVGRVDGLIAGTRVVLEVDGRGYHDDPDAVEEDRRRGAELVAAGYTRVQLSSTRIRTDWAWCVRMVRGAMAQFPGAAPPLSPFRS